MTKYGERDDLLMTVTIQPPRSNHVIQANGRMRDILKLLNKTEWQAYTMKVDVDAFLEEFHRPDSTHTTEPQSLPTTAKTEVN